MITLYTQLGIALKLLPSSPQSWFHENYMVLNPKNMLLYVPQKNPETTGNFSFQGIVIKTTDSQKLVRVIIDLKLNFWEHMKTIC